MGFRGLDGPFDIGNAHLRDQIRARLQFRI
jgi:hypothetical protein